MNKIIYADDDTTPVNRLIRMRLPSLIIGLTLGLLLSFLTSRFEEVLSTNIEVAFFIPFIVYMAAAVGVQTQTIYTRDLRTGKANFQKYLIKETLLGFFIALASGLIVAVVTLVWFDSPKLSLAVSLGMFGTIVLAPLVALIVTELLQLEKTDPAVSGGPIATVIQDALSIMIYGFIASAILL
ncbi:hypothetical protein A3A54_00875 [Candidatus Curtissbacteria bacterium RIFCSPLOWO2_01_FULL_39_62]|uniref:SLC41A/MgtE integral membrane domain-containing protein n=2 Tax=Candidatus Curtissiibacteriota TaxID=1752717 RepID=A0A1F5G792_9BACT|nr:MAG: hypothetical protein A3D04_03355 [Candidatus Curtissbacteria bacterium RIFCSPHIGHO2_02_FULL_40_16b]OGE00368.1 MAG: hypothetical protein A3J17_02550 [Candidatus Curtissbacteria bacterium RIFCSPLOWO2_02_FULL_40_11]OGE01314.1 MAG: hypothetical protein A3A54_00875 [Candidatus Curtissbacteria bacterium RIFCSPLOWO2_01_FULL_39_62]OGE13404.1 MAG: hypothetical protein A3G14_02985 [Candidatus Curtissbacteria bacterium RIFCSPLOWO2_12_FULL_38_9]